MVRVKHVEGDQQTPDGNDPGQRAFLLRNDNAKRP